jgi:hypothetical protein
VTFVIPPTAGRQSASAIVLEGTTRAITAWTRVVQPAMAMLSVALFPGPSQSTSLSALPVTQMISIAKGIILVAKMVQSRKTEIAPAAVVTGLVIEILIDIESSANRFSHHHLAVRKRHLSSGRYRKHEANNCNFEAPAPIHNIKQA